ncbi:hypothetical protein HN371_04640 [Candidatus Poribacteria bacterium]|jgi:hypothetical protein|nr:hypothetical protein [Candidatus Poribacteria bacterium]MBT5536808.1 hypothetical protein [Candidatus Poribacteria bacterium]MBT5710491.1 hypothetical protein [Candidatus Poribacteria bacterium]MBT7098917.1 hypothetical protein [Candidatus Poribacteria bacterium]MBT7805326.1 hypothetical protein [Candidatus Poribacteria bacterium]
MTWMIVVLLAVAAFVSLGGFAIYAAVYLPISRSMAKPGRGASVAGDVADLRDRLARVEEAVEEMREAVAEAVLQTHERDALGSGRRDPDA